MYIPFVQVTQQLMDELLIRGYNYYVLQRFEWVSITERRGFLLSAYADLQEGSHHANQLDPKEGKILQIPDDYDKIYQLIQESSGYAIFLNKFKDTDWECRMLRVYKKNIENYLRFNTRFKRKDPVGIFFTLEYGRVWATIESNGIQLKVKAYNVIK